MIIILFAAYICKRYDEAQAQWFAGGNMGFQKLIETEISKMENVDSALEFVNSVRILDYLPQLSPSKYVNIQNLWSEQTPQRGRNSVLDDHMRLVSNLNEFTTTSVTKIKK